VVVVVARAQVMMTTVVVVAVGVVVVVEVGGTFVEIITEARVGRVWSSMSTMNSSFLTPTSSCSSGNV
jgi:hypothetical protein